MKTKRLLGTLGICCIFTIGLSLAPPSLTGEDKERSPRSSAKEVYTGSVAAIGGQFAGASRPFTLEISGYTPSDEAQRDFDILRTKGQDDFIKAISHLGGRSQDSKTSRLRAQFCINIP